MDSYQLSRPSSRLKKKGGRAKRLALASLLAALLLGPQAASAAPFVDVTYDLSDSTAVSTIPLLGVTTTVPPRGTISGGQKIRYSSDSATGVATGPVDLISFYLSVHATVGYTGYTAGGGKAFITLNTADLHIEFLGLTLGAGPGQLLAGGTITPLGASGSFRVTGSLHCFRLCAALNVSATTTTVLRPDRFKAPLPVLTGAVGQPHVLRGTATGVSFAVAPYATNVGIAVTGTTFLVGREISRTPVPEPSTLPLLASGLIAFVLAPAAWRWWIQE